MSCTEHQQQQQMQEQQQQRQQLKRPRGEEDEDGCKREDEDEDTHKPSAEKRHTDGNEADPALSDPDPDSNAESALQRLTRLASLENTPKCAVCHEPLLQSFLYSACGHDVCGVCVSKLRGKPCVHCRASGGTYVPNYACRALFDDTFPYTTELYKLQRDPATVCEYVSECLGVRVSIQSMNGAKDDTVVACLRLIEKHYTADRKTVDITNFTRDAPKILSVHGLMAISGVWSMRVRGRGLWYDAMIAFHIDRCAFTVFIQN